LERGVKEYSVGGASQPLSIQYSNERRGPRKGIVSRILIHLEREEQ